MRRKFCNILWGFGGTVALWFFFHCKFYWWKFLWCVCVVFFASFKLGWFIFNVCLDRLSCGRNILGEIEIKPQGTLFAYCVLTILYTLVFQISPRKKPKQKCIMLMMVGSIVLNGSRQRPQQKAIPKLKIRSQHDAQTGLFLFLGWLL